MNDTDLEGVALISIMTQRPFIECVSAFNALRLQDLARDGIVFDLQSLRYDVFEAFVLGALSGLTGGQLDATEAMAHQWEARLHQQVSQAMAERHRARLHVVGNGNVVGEQLTVADMLRS